MNRPDYHIRVHRSATLLHETMAALRARGVELRATRDGGIIAQPTQKEVRRVGK